MALVGQGRKYVVATEQWFRNNPNSCPAGKIPPIDVVFLVGKGYDGSGDNYIRSQLQSINAKVLTYSDLIIQSKQAYSEYQSKKDDAARIMKIVDGI